MSVNPYREQQPVNVIDPSGRLSPGYFNFPFTPTITVSTSSNYTGYDLTHTNFQQRAFESSNNAEIQLTAPIVVRNADEATSVLLGSNFFRAAMKMSFGKNDPNAGLPPPIIRFNAYGVYQNVPLLIRDFVWNFDADVDYVEAGSFRMPVTSTFVIGAVTTYGTRNVRDNFTLEAYNQGRLRNRGYV